MTDGQDAGARRALRDIRRDAGQTWRAWPKRSAVAVWHTVAGLFRAIAEFVMEFMAELIPAIAALLLFALVSAAAAWGWQRSPAATVVFIAAMVVFIAFGARELWFRPVEGRRGRIAALAAGTCVFVLIWAAYLVLYLPTSL